MPISNTHTGRVPGLDGLWAISAGFVVFAHLCMSGALPFHQSIIEVGNLGVRIFFVISGVHHHGDVGSGKRADRHSLPSGLLYKAVLPNLASLGDLSEPLNTVLNAEVRLTRGRECARSIII
jgi:hypothetical protein